MKEIWKPVYGYEKYYEVSNFGNIKSLQRIFTNIIGITCNRKEKILKPQITRDGYLCFILKVDKKNISKNIHRIVMESFIGPKNMQINHIDGNKKNNQLNNLEYCTCRQNVIHFWKDKQRTSKFNGVCFDKNRKKWIASITNNGKGINIGRYLNEYDALKARIKYEIKIYQYESI
jgi:hypothetical protein